MFKAVKQPQRRSGYTYRYFADPQHNHKLRIKRNSLDKQTEAKKKVLQIIIPIKSNFFKATFNPSKYIWVVYHKHILAERHQKYEKFYQQLKEAFKYLKYSEEDLPICSSLSELNKFAMTYQLKVAIDHSIQKAIGEYDQIVENANVISVCIIGEIKTNFAKLIRKNVNSSKVHMVEERYDNVISLIARDTERTHSYLSSQASSNLDILRTFVFPNFMFLNTEYKAETLAYHNNLLCLINLHKDKVDLQLLRDKFIRECRENEGDTSSQKLMDKYETMPLSHRDRLLLYTQQSFFYKYLNNTLRMARTTDQLYLIGEPFNRLFHAIKYYYHHQGLDRRARSKMKLFRGTRLLEEEYSQLKKSVGQYIEIQGFISTSIDEKVAVRFANGVQVGRKVVLEFQFEDVTTKNENILVYDFGYADLNSMSDFDQGEVLINAMNVYKVVEITTKGDLDYIIFKYGTILNVLDLDDGQVAKLDENDRVGYYTYMQRMEDGRNYADIGQINRDIDTQRCVSYYQTKIRAQDTTDKPDKQKMAHFQHKLADAYYNNSQHHKVIELLEKAKLASIHLVRTEDGKEKLSFKKLRRYDSAEETIKGEVDMRVKLAKAKVKVDDFCGAEKELDVVEQSLDEVLEEQWNAQIAFKQIEASYPRIDIKEALGNHIQRKNLLTSIIDKLDRYIQTLQSSNTKQKNGYFLKAYRLKAKAIYQLANMQKSLDREDRGKFEELIQNFRGNWEKIQKIIGKKSKEHVWNYHVIHEVGRKDDANFSDNEKEFHEKLVRQQNLEESLINIHVSLDKRQSIISEINEKCQFIEALMWDQKSIDAQIKCIKTLQGEYVAQTLVSGDNHPNTLAVGVKIAEKYRKIRNFESAIDILQLQRKKVPYETMPQHSIIGKNEYMLGMAYLQMGEFGQAHWYFLRALQIFKSLNKVDFQRYGPRYKVQLQLGRTLTFLCSYIKSQEKLNLYERFVKKQKLIHSDVAEVKTYKGILYMRWQKYSQSKQEIVQSAQMYAFTKGSSSPEYAKCKCMSALVESKLGAHCNKSKVIQDIEQANAIYNRFYSSISGESIHCMTYMMKFYNGEIYKKFQQYDLSYGLYGQSIRDQEMFQRVKKGKIDKIEKDRDNYEQVMCVTHRIVDPQGQMAKKKTHELSCKASMIECRLAMQGDIGEIELEIESLNDALMREIRQTEREFVVKDVPIEEGVSSTNRQLLVTVKKYMETASSKVPRRKKKEQERMQTVNETCMTETRTLITESKINF